MSKKRGGCRYLKDGRCLISRDECISEDNPSECGLIGLNDFFEKKDKERTINRDKARKDKNRKWEDE